MSPVQAPFALAVLALLAACRPSAGPSPGGASSGPAPAPEPSRLVGLWMRTDADYSIAVDDAGASGRLAARYLNPRPIHVSRAEWKRDGSRLTVLVELQDRGYPGSYYELVYDGAGDALFGTYHHLGLNQDFKVSFFRQSPAGPESAP